MGKFQFAIDRGGTFTDIWTRYPNGQMKVLKLLSEDPSNYNDAPREGIRRIIEEVCSLVFASNIVKTLRFKTITYGIKTKSNTLWF